MNRFMVEDIEVGDKVFEILKDSHVIKGDGEVPFFKDNKDKCDYLNKIYDEGCLSSEKILSDHEELKAKIDSVYRMLSLACDDDLSTYQAGIIIASAASMLTVALNGGPNEITR